MRLGEPGAGLGPLLLWQLPLRTGVAATDLRPIEKLPDLGSPLLVVSGAEDRHTTWAETQRIYDSAQAPKEIWKVPHAAHVDLHSYLPKEYETRILHFLAKYLRNEA